MSAAYPETKSSSSSLATTALYNYPVLFFFSGAILI